jgi:hypothetical protein
VKKNLPRIVVVVVVVFAAANMQTALKIITIIKSKKGSHAKTSYMLLLFHVAKRVKFMKIATLYIELIMTRMWSEKFFFGFLPETRFTHMNAHGMGERESQCMWQGINFL